MTNVESHGGELLVTLTITLRDGRVLTGQYSYLVALARQEAAMKQEDCLRAEIS